MRALEFITGHVIYNLAYTYKFQLKTTIKVTFEQIEWTKKPFILQVCDEFFSPYQKTFPTKNLKNFNFMGQTIMRV